MIVSFWIFYRVNFNVLSVFEPVDDSRECAWGRSDQDKLFLYTMTPKRRLKKLRIKMCCESALVNLHIQLEPLCELVDVLEDKKSPFYQEYVNTYYSFTTYIEEIVDTLSAWNLQYKKSKIRGRSNYFAKDLKHRTQKHLAAISNAHGQRNG